MVHRQLSQLPWILHAVRQSGLYELFLFLCNGALHMSGGRLATHAHRGARSGPIAQCNPRHAYATGRLKIASVVVDFQLVTDTAASRLSRASTTENVRRQ